MPCHAIQMSLPLSLLARAMIPPPVYEWRVGDIGGHYQAASMISTEDTDWASMDIGLHQDYA